MGHLQTSRACGPGRRGRLHRRAEADRAARPGRAGRAPLPARRAVLITCRDLPLTSRAVLRYAPQVRAVVLITDGQGGAVRRECYRVHAEAAGVGEIGGDLPRTGVPQGGAVVAGASAGSHAAVRPDRHLALALAAGGGESGADVA